MDGSGSYYGDGGPAISALLNAPQCVASDAAGNLFIADSGNNAIRRVDAVTGIIDTIAGGVSAHIAGGPTDTRSGLGTSGAQGEGGNALYALFDLPRGIAVDPSGNVFVGDYNNEVVRELSPNAKGGYNIVSIIGEISSSNNDAIKPTSGAATSSTDALTARMSSKGVDDVATDPNGNIYFLDSNNGKVLTGGCGAQQGLRDSG